MKCVGKIAIWLASGLVLIAGARADDAAVASADNPYAPIVARNLFNLNPVTADAPVGDPPPKITLNGIMSISGHLQVLFKVAGTGKPGQSAKDQSYILSEGQRQDDIEVVNINEKASLVTFNNHGTVQDLPLANAPSATTSGPGSGGSGQVYRPNNSARPVGGPGGGNGGNVIGSVPGRGSTGGQNRGMGNNADQNQNPTTPGGLPLQAVPTRAGVYNPQDNPPSPAMTPEQKQKLEA